MQFVNTCFMQSKIYLKENAFDYSMANNVGAIKIITIISLVKEGTVITQTKNAQGIRHKHVVVVAPLRSTQVSRTSFLCDCEFFGVVSNGKAYKNLVIR